MVKVCTKCGKALPAGRFGWSDKQHTKKKSYCRKCHNELGKRYYRKHAAAAKASAKRWSYGRKAEHRDFLDAHKSFVGCFICGEDKPWRLDFHHLSTKENSISRLCGGDFNKILDEMGRCIVLCRNCHADVHHREDQ